MSNKINLQFSVLVTIILIAALSRILPHLQNFSPICALGLFGAAHFDKKWKAFLIPLCATLVSDILISKWIYTNHPFFYEGIQWQYISYALIVMSGFAIFKRVNVGSVLLGIISSTAIFFFITNAGCWYGNPIYKQDFHGFIASILAGIPFVKGTIVSNVVYTVALFGGYYALQNKFAVLRTSQLKYS